MIGAQLAAHLDPGAVRQPDVQDRYLGTRRRDARQRFGDRRCLADDVDVAGRRDGSREQEEEGEEGGGGDDEGGDEAGLGRQARCDVGADDAGADLCAERAAERVKISTSAPRAARAPASSRT